MRTWCPTTEYITASPGPVFIAIIYTVRGTVTPKYFLYTRDSSAVTRKIIRWTNLKRWHVYTWFDIMQIITCDKMSINILIERNARMRYADLKWTFHLMSYSVLGLSDLSHVSWLKTPWTVEPILHTSILKYISLLWPSGYM